MFANPARRKMAGFLPRATTALVALLSLWPGLLAVKKLRNNVALLNSGGYNPISLVTDLFHDVCNARYQIADPVLLVARDGAAQ